MTPTPCSAAWKRVTGKGCGGGKVARGETCVVLHHCPIFTRENSNETMVGRVWHGRDKVEGKASSAYLLVTTHLRAWPRVALEEVGLFADGAAVKEVGKECFRSN